MSTNVANGTTFAGPKGVGIYQAIVLASSLRLYAKTGIKPTRGVGPKHMMKLAEQITGLKFKAKEYILAAEALRTWADKTKAEIDAE